MRLFKKVRKLILPLAFVSVGVFGFFQANAAPDEDCIEVATYLTDLHGYDVSTFFGYSMWQGYFYGCKIAGQL